VVNLHSGNAFRGMLGTSPPPATIQSRARLNLLEFYAL
jgi:hypothetical protein